MKHVLRLVPLGNNSSLQELHKKTARLTELLLSKQSGKLTVLSCRQELHGLLRTSRTELLEISDGL